MIDAIARLRKAGDECASRARSAGPDAADLQAEMMDMSAKWHWLAGEAAKLCQRSQELIGRDAACGLCREKCLG